MAIQRVSLRTQIRNELLARMRDGRVQPGEGINEVQLAAELGVSRTPLREALIALEHAGHLDSEEGKGFSFLPLSRDELMELAPVIAELEGLALELSDVSALKRIGKQLLAMAEEFSAEAVPLHLLAAKDAEWHGIMISACPNRRLLEVVDSTRLALNRYQSLLFRDETVMTRVADEHVAVARCLMDGDVPAAREALKVNWLQGTARIARTVA